MATIDETNPAISATPPPAAPATPQYRPTGIQKEYREDSPLCRVTFTLPKAAAPQAEQVCIVGEFNDWSTDATPMQRRADGEFFVTLELEKNRSYRFRYLIDGTTFENDWNADRYDPNPYGGNDSVVEV
ncbi:MAG: isoamylase early set domain-containing protein [Thermoleophilia bacterium]|jgi:1,4-alpha-glucan branching enzyme